jgi:signal transduction histidine kinase
MSGMRDRLVMNRQILIQVTGPAVLIGLLLFGVCVAGAWYINRLQANRASLRAQNASMMEATHGLEISVRNLRFHGFLYLVNPTADHFKPIQQDHAEFERALLLARAAAATEEERDIVQEIDKGYQRYRDELDQLATQVRSGGPAMDFRQLAEAHPIRHVVDWCQELSKVNERLVEQTSAENDRNSRQASYAMLLLGILGPVSGLIIGYGMARGLSRSIYQLSVRVQDIAQRLDQDVGSVSVVADGNIRHLDEQMQDMVHRVEEVVDNLQRHQREMLRAEQLSAVGQLAASVAHEVRNPLAGVKMLVEAALRPKGRTVLTAEDLQMIHGEIARVEQTVQGFLDFARLPTPKRVACDLREAVGQAIDLVRFRAQQQGVALDFRCGDEAVYGYVDRGQLCTVLVNLFLNALDAMPTGGRLEVELAGSLEKGTTITVADSGGGIAADILPRLFTPFASTKPTGTGLGLSISRRILEEHGGRLRADNRPEGGARFRISLPAGRGPAVELPRPPAEALARAT